MNSKPPDERTVVVGVGLKSRQVAHSLLTPGTDTDLEESLDELATLAESAGAQVVERIVQIRPALDAATLVGSGKVEEIRNYVEGNEIDAVIFDRELTPTQLRNLERRLPAKVLDRTQLILDIFARRARTAEGQLQVELAQLNYLLPRLAGRGTQMSRLGGGIGTRGPGETQLETDRRRIGRRIAKLKSEIDRVRATRGVQRSQRQAVPLSTVSLVGYTNAGKSTLFNRLTGAEVLADARMFATLDPTVRQIRLPSQRRVLLSDTVGFIRSLPTTLVDAFRATLEEVTAAALLLHVVDVTSSTASEQTAHVMKVLGEIGAEGTKQILVLSKSDRLSDADRIEDLQTMTHRILGETARQNATEAVLVSGQRGDGTDRLLELIDQELKQDPVARQCFRFPLGEGRALNLLHDRAAIVSQKYIEDYCEVVADTPLSIRDRLSEFTVEKCDAV
ncbi:MAG: GTP-binding protein HSR1-related [Bryobacterales bacterium]|nr:GTP-binding protein HSR1-related [Bryobacterales bacterium]